MPLPPQPVLSAEIAFTDAELDYIENSPPGLFPENQNSNFGLKRKIWTDRIQELIGQQMTLYNERFPSTSQNFLDEWERVVGLPLNPTSRTVTQRQQDVLGRLARGAWTRPRRNGIIERFITATFGTSISLVPEGVALTAGGLPLYSDAAPDLTPLYRVVETISTFHYQVRIKDTVLLDFTGLSRELDRQTPAGITFDVVAVPTP